MSERKAVRVSITGEVQGVSYRDWTMRKAEKLGLTGWVRNEPDGSVSALVAGPPQGVAEMLLLFRQGPPAARVADVASQTADPAEAPPVFRITG